MSSDFPPPLAAVAETLSARERILAVAGRLFFRDGYRAIGVDRVIAEAGVAKATFYKHFPSKDDLIVAWMNLAEAQSRAFLEVDGPQPLTAYADAMIDVAGQDFCLGCTYQSSASEFGEISHPAHQAALGVKRRVLAEMERRAVAQGVQDPAEAAANVFLLIEGVWAARRMFGAEAPLAGAKAAVRRLIA